MSNLPSYHKTTKKAISPPPSLLDSSATLSQNNKSSSPYPRSSSRGFTIVELLIVIVVIGILAATSIVAYNGISQKANNAAIINAASQSLKMIQAYVAQEGVYPVKSEGAICITVESECQRASEPATKILSNATFNTRMATVGSLPKSVPVEGNRLYGISYEYYSTDYYNGRSQPAFLRYYLSGINQDCGVSGVMVRSGSTYVTSTTGYTGNDTGLNKTVCSINIPGPSHS